MFYLELCGLYFVVENGNVALKRRALFLQVGERALIVGYVTFYLVELGLKRGALLYVGRLRVRG